MMPGMETAALYDDDVSIELIGCPVHVPEPFFSFIDKVKPAGKKIIVTDSLVGTGHARGHCPHLQGRAQGLRREGASCG